jgi:AraC family ethanolamine operon transcriptional activator
MSVDQQLGRIAVSDVEELNFAVSPWDLDMRQVSAGALHATLDFIHLDGLLLTRERWSHGVLATGATPAGYVALAGPSSQRSFKWCGEEIAAGRVACGVDVAECDFVVPDRAAHWVILAPVGQIAGWAGDQSVVQRLESKRVLRCAPALTRKISRTVDRCVDVTRSCPALLTETRLTAVMARDLREAITMLVTNAAGSVDRRIARPRELACREAMSIVEGAADPISVGELAAQVGVSTRSLERAFRERLGISPKQFVRLHRQSRLHRALRLARADGTTVTQVALGLGFTELGRMAGEYKQVFGELPSATLRRDNAHPERRLRDALAPTSTS